MKLMVGIPSFGQPDPLFALDSFAPLMYHLGRRHPEIKEVLVNRDTRTYRHHARQAIVNSALQTGMDYLLMLDDDITFAPTAFDILWEHREYDAVSGLYMTRGIPPVPCIFRMTPSEGSKPILNYPKDKLIEVEVVGFGFVLFRTELFRKIPPPHFQIGNWLGEDVAFGVKAQAVGAKLVVHTGCHVGHILEQKRVITEKTYEKYKEQIREHERTKMGAAQWTGTSREVRGSGEPRQLSPKDITARCAEVFHAESAP